MSQRTIGQEWRIVGLSSKYPQGEIARIVGVGRWTVLNVQHKYHVVHRFGRQHAAANRHAFDEHAWGTVLEALYIDQGLPICEVARRCGVHRSTIRRRLHILGFRVRSGVESHRGSKHPSYAETMRAKLPRCESGCGRGFRGDGPLCWACRRKVVS